MASQAPGPGYVWISDGSSGSDPSSGGGGYWAPNPYATLNEQPAPATTGIGGPDTSAASINAKWQMSQPLQNQFAELLTNPVSGYSPTANYGAPLGRFMFSHSAPVPPTAPVGWGRYPGTGGAPPPPKWLTNPTTPPIPNPNPPPVTFPPTTPPGTGTPPPVTPPVTPPPVNWNNGFNSPSQNAKASTAAQATGMLSYVNGKPTIVPIPAQYRNMPIPSQYVGKALPVGAFTSLWANSQGTDWSKVKPQGY